ncbi:MAG TPA: hypothetical protein VMM13_08180, partial [Euzebya sp.]|nr:hypothetical protein [Euzebya sp.]
MALPASTPHPPPDSSGRPHEEDFGPLGLPRRRTEAAPEPSPEARATSPDDDDADDAFGPYGPGGDLLLPSELQALRQRERAAGRPSARAGRAVRRRVDDMFGAGGPAFRLLANAHAASTAGDTLIAIALANSLFFAVPSSQARGNVALYLLLTVAPFAIIGPALGWVLDRPGAERLSLIWASLLRVAAGALLIVLADSLWLFPLAFMLLVLSRVHGISRSAMLPQALSNAIALVTANARLAQVSVLGGAVAAPIGAALAFIGSEAVLVAAAIVFGVAAWQSMALPRLEPADDGHLEEATAGSERTGSSLPLRTPTPRTAEFLPQRADDPSADTPSPARPPEAASAASDVGSASDAALQDRTETHPKATASQLRLARFATAVVRLLNGFLVLNLAFAFRDVEAPIADFGAVLAAAGAGYGLASLAAPTLERRLREEPMVVAALAVEAAAAFIAGQFFGLPAAAFLSLAAGYGWGTAKFAYDGLLQATVSPAGR